MHETRSPQSILALCRELDLKTVILATTDLIGRWTQVTIPVSRLEEATFEDGITIDRKVLPYFGVSVNYDTYPVNKGPTSDLSLIPIAETAIVDRAAQFPSLILLCALQETVTRDEWLLDGRSLAKRTAGYCTSSGTADTITAAIQLEYSILPKHLDRRETYASFRKEVRPDIHSPLSNDDHLLLRENRLPPEAMAEFEAYLVQNLVSCGIPVDAHWSIDESEGRYAIRLRPDTLVRAADWTALTKNQINIFLSNHGFQPSLNYWKKEGPKAGELFPQFAFYRGNESLFGISGRDGFSDSVVHAMAGISRHRSELVTLANLTNDSYVSTRKFLSQTNDTQPNLDAICRNTHLCFDSRDITQPRIEVGLPDGASNPYVALSAIVLAIIDGLQNKLGANSAGRSTTTNHPTLGENPMAPLAPTLAEAIELIGKNTAFMSLGEIFSDAWIRAWSSISQMAATQAKT